MATIDEELAAYSAQKDAELKDIIRRKAGGQLSEDAVNYVFDAIKGNQIEMLGDRGTSSLRPLAEEVLKQIGSPERWMSEVEAGKKEFEKKQLAGAESQAQLERMVQEEALKREQASLAKKFSDIFGRAEEAGTEKIGRQFIPARQKLISEEAALGRLRSPVSIVPLSRLEEQKQNAISSFLGDIAAQRATGEFDLAKSIEAVLQGEREAERRSKEFGQELGFKRESLAKQIEQANMDRALKERLGISELNKRYRDEGIMDKISKGLGIATSVTGLGTSFLGTKQAGGGRAGGLFA